MPVTRLTRDLEAGSGSALFFLAWDILITLDDEVEFIWSKPRGSWVKWAFLFARYFALATQICNRATDLLVTYSLSTTHSNAIRIWFAAQGLLGFLYFTNAEIVMMIRVYALYNKSQWILYGFSAMLVIELSATLIGIGLTFPSSPFDPTLFVTNTPGTFVYSGIATIVSQLIVLSLSVARYLRGNWARARIVKLMMRDGTLAFAVLFVICVLMVIYHTLDVPFAACEYAWAITLTSVTECRLILNLQQLPIPATTWTATPEFTTILTHDRARFLESYPMTAIRETSHDNDERRAEDTVIQTRQDV